MRRYELTDEQWELIADLFPPLQGNGRPFHDHRSMVNAMFWVLNTGSPWRDLPERFGPWQTAYNRFNRWRKAGIWDRLMDAIVKAHDGKVQMIDSSIVRVHQHASGVKIDTLPVAKEKLMQAA